MTHCSNCGESIPDVGNYSNNFGNATASVATQPRQPSQISNSLTTDSNRADLTVRLNRAMRRAELLGYAAAGLALAILALIIAISFL